ncbi:hypothetical protein OIDMADRAFT_52717 [Oidiodendron maius Zn]|uniref:DUF7924 domain-containing protein n=1 Tax=Oidiodendron maius (strain Zn) TaxID=913774 RepID=A0A0C3DLI2_OIDMZ|nr:hypothetical protein OIDMADRAFT_52717 [Oidiodendron maius Zn]
MPPKGKRKAARPKPPVTRKGTTQTPQSRQQARNAPRSNLARSHNEFRSSSRRSAGNLQPVEDDPESILRRARTSRRPRKETNNRQVETLASGYPSGLVRSIENTLLDQYQSFYESTAEYSDNGTSSSLDIDPEQRFYRYWGYLPPLDEEVAALIDFIMANPDMAKVELGKIGPDKVKFSDGLECRNVTLNESAATDPRANHIRKLSLNGSIRETDEISELHGQLWAMDRAKCQNGSNEALFQRTIMMSLIARHCLIYERQPSSELCLDFSVEQAWDCPPMPSRAYAWRAKFLTQPKPDLAVCFCRQKIIPDDSWRSTPTAVKRLACYEKMVGSGRDRIFHFLTIEAKRADIPSSDIRGKLQSLNNASQSLHNMFEFFRDAGHKEHFFEKVRFFSVVASTEGLTIRIHRAIELPENASAGSFIMPDRTDYPLKFEHQEFFTVNKDDFDRKTVFETFEKILIGYGVNELCGLLKNAAKALTDKLNADTNEGARRADENFYRYGQTNIPSNSRKATPGASLAPSRTNNSVEMPDVPSRAETMTQIQPSSSFSKRGREQSQESAHAGRKIRRQKV